jgi:hypothetical protein
METTGTAPGLVYPTGEIPIPGSRALRVPPGVLLSPVTIKFGGVVRSWGEYPVPNHVSLPVVPELITPQCVIVVFGLDDTTSFSSAIFLVACVPQTLNSYLLPCITASPYTLCSFLNVFVAKCRHQCYVLMSGKDR